jgi:hypothetical protein
MVMAVNTNTGKLGIKPNTNNNLERNNNNKIERGNTEYYVLVT